MAEYIEREKLMEAFAEWQKTLIETYGRNDEYVRCLDSIMLGIDNAPAADVRPVVLCKDCIHSDIFAPDCTEATFPLKCLLIRYGGVCPDWFCEHGEKREES